MPVALPTALPTRKAAPISMGAAFNFCRSNYHKRRGYRIVEVPISYHARSYEEGKKIGVRDGIKALAAILWFRFFD